MSEAPKSERIFLTGFMGCGKSTVGPLLARALGYRFIDLDAVIEERAGKPIPAIFREEGEAAFRALESHLLRKAGARRGVVIAVGGGTLVREDNLRYALEAGRVLYLEVSAKELSRRLEEEGGSRPLLQDVAGKPRTGPALIRHVERLLSGRVPYYERAHHTIPAGGRPVEAVLDEALRVLGMASPRRQEPHR